MLFHLLLINLKRIAWIFFDLVRYVRYRVGSTSRVAKISRMHRWVPLDSIKIIHNLKCTVLLFRARLSHPSPRFVCFATDVERWRILALPWMQVPSHHQQEKLLRAFQKFRSFSWNGFYLTVRFRGPKITST